MFAMESGKWEHLITINENLCDAVNKYMGEFMHDLQEKAGLERGACPVPAVISTHVFPTLSNLSTSRVTTKLNSTPSTLVISNSRKSRRVNLG